MVNNLLVLLRHNRELDEMEYDDAISFILRLSPSDAPDAEELLRISQCLDSHPDCVILADAAINRIYGAHSDQSRLSLSSLGSRPERECRFHHSLITFLGALQRTLTK